MVIQAQPLSYPHVHVHVCLMPVVKRGEDEGWGLGVWCLVSHINVNVNVNGKGACSGLQLQSYDPVSQRASAKWHANVNGQHEWRCRCTCALVGTGTSNIPLGPCALVRAACCLLCVMQHRPVHQFAVIVLQLGVIVGWSSWPYLSFS
jgi:hypothetical protein